MPKKENYIKGKLGESLALEYLKKNKYKILETNFTCKIGEIDIIAMKKKQYIFVEVKNRSSDRFGMPREAVNYYKQQKIRMVAQVYLKMKHKEDVDCQFDVIEILDGEINHIENCF